MFFFKKWPPFVLELLTEKSNEKKRLIGESGQNRRTTLTATPSQQILKNQIKKPLTSLKTITEGVRHVNRIRYVKSGPPGGEGDRGAGERYFYAYRLLLRLLLGSYLHRG